MSTERASLFGADDSRSRPARLAALAGQLLALPRLPPAAVLFYARALYHGRRSGDTVSLAPVARPRELGAGTADIDALQRENAELRRQLGQRGS